MPLTLRRSSARQPHLPLLLILSLSSLVSAQTQPQPTPCFRWSGQMTIANAKGETNSSTLYYFGGEAQTTESQEENTWTNALVSMSLDEDWQTGAPPLKLVQADNGNYSSPPAVTLGALWASADGNTLYQYGGSFSDSPSVDPPLEHIYAYSIEDDAWSVVDTTGDTIGRVAEGQPAIVQGQGTNGENVGYYSHGHQDDHTTQGWSNQIDRIYLNSMVSFDMGSKRTSNITSYSSAAKTSNSSTALTNPVSRADGTLSYVPGLGTDSKGVLVSIGGATQSQYVDNSVLDIYDIGAGGWTRQSVSGASVGSRVNHCTVRGTQLVDGDNEPYHFLYVYGGQKLNQSDRDSAMYILTIHENDYVWTFVGDDLASQPNGRAGHQCVLEGNQLVVMGGVVRADVFNTTSTSWQSEYKANTVFSTPTLLRNITGEDSSSSGGDPSTNSDGGGGGTNIGAIVGGVVGGVVGLLIIALLVFLLMRKKKRERQEEERKAEKERLAAVGRSNSGSSGAQTFEGFAFPGEKSHRPSASNGSEFPPSLLTEFERRTSHFEANHDDNIEEVMAGRDVYLASGMAPKRALRVVNADEPDE
ncbi:hypothetical protein JCM8547_001294 [Rhodosporidiobolus lusitaniae]